MDRPEIDWTTPRALAQRIAEDDALDGIRAAEATAWARVQDDTFVQDAIDMEQPRIGADLARCFRNLDHRDRHAVDAILAALHQMRATLLTLARVM